MQTVIHHPSKIAVDTARACWSRANDEGECFAGGPEIDSVVCELLGSTSDKLVLVVQEGRVLACAYSYGASWCADVTQALIDLA